MKTLTSTLLFRQKQSMRKDKGLTANCACVGYTMLTEIWSIAGHSHLESSSASCLIPCMDSSALPVERQFPRTVASSGSLVLSLASHSHCPCSCVWHDGASPFYSVEGEVPLALVVPSCVKTTSDQPVQQSLDQLVPGILG